ncbi:MAG: flagellar motor switch phosphatase FliY [Bacillus sp. (in: firmicutes)]
MLSEDMLSQDEIDALLRGTDEADDSYTDVAVKERNINDYVNGMERDALGEIGNISFGSSATALSTLLNQKVEITTPTVSLIERKRLQEEFPHPYVAIQVKYTVGFSGVNLLVIKQSDAAIIADLMLGGDGLNISDILGEIQLSAVQEAMNQMMGSAATSMSTIFNKKVDISPPSIDLLNIETGEGEQSIPQDDPLIKISFRLKIGELIDSNIMQLLPIHFAKELVNDLLNPVEQPATQMKTEVPVSGQMPVHQKPSGIESLHIQSQVQQQPVYPEAVQTDAVYNSPLPPSSGPQHLGSAYGQPGQPVNVQPAQFSDFDVPHLQPNEAKNLNMLLDIPLQVTVELGRTNRSVKEILELSAGSIIELDKLAGEPVDILVNSRLVAKGEVVVIDENFGVRVTDILSESERLNKLR